MNKHREYFDQVRLKHRQTKSRLRSLLFGAQIDEKPLLSPADSPVGQWIYGEGLKAYGHLPEMHALEKVHTLIHREARHLVTLYQAGRVEEARTGLLNTEEISGLLDELIHRIEAKTREANVQSDGLEALENASAAGNTAVFRELQSFKERFELVAKATNDAIWDWDLLTDQIWWNAGFQTMFGYQDREIESGIESWYGRIHPEDQQRVVAGIHAVIDHGGKQWSDEYRFRRADGSYAYVLDRGYALHDAAGKPYRMLGSMQDVSERKLSEQALLESRQREVTFLAEAQRQRDRLGRFFSQAPAAICVLDGPEMVFELVNPHFQRLYPGRDLLGKRVLEALPEMARSPFYPILENIYQTGETFEGKEVLFPLARREGGPLEDIYFDFIYQPRFNKQGEVDGIIAFGYEVTAQVVARQQVEESRQRFQMLSEAIPQMVWTATPDGQVDYYNHQWYAYTGLDFAQSRGQGWSRVVHPQDLGNLQFHWTEALQSGRPYQVEARLRRADGAYRWFLIRAVPFQDEVGNVKQWFGTDTDIEERKEVEETLYQVSQELFAANGELAAANEEIRASHEELAATNQRLVHINADLDNFIYTASHDLKAPILNIEGLLKVLIRRIGRQAGEDQEVQYIFTLMQNSVLRFKETINDLTDIARIQKQTEQESEPVDLPPIVQDTLSDLAGQIEESGAQIETRLAACSPIVFSRKNLKSVVYNLLSNALKYRHPERLPRILLSCYQEGDYQVVSVQDNGLGMNSTDQDKIFGMFKRLHTHVEGTGIGLYIVKKMVENAGGKIAVKSKVGAGSTFRVYFKLQPVK